MNYFRFIRSIIPLLFYLLNLPAFSQTKPNNQIIYLEHSSSNLSVIIHQNNLEATEYKDSYDNPVSSIPSGRKEVKKKYTLTKEELNDLITLIKKNGFMSLPKSEYGANIKDRFYSYTLYVKAEGKEKKVLYRSNPSAEAAPKAFLEIEAMVNKLYQKAR
ncbi:MAG: hypothetical protein NZ529_02245 [Cytophagaceae bacterium]|nr:hypothetical protein [Cytophagaceae bacterium]MDW8455589.1 hypothetical protein [Cytophagaceae bacterium]